MARARRVVLGVTALPALVLAVLAVEIELAGRRSELQVPPLALDGRVGDDSGQAIRVVWLGDSTAAGVGASTVDAALPRLVAEGLGPPVELTVLARSGATVAEVVAGQLPVVAELEPDVVFVSVGANDVTHLSSRADVERGYRRLVAGLPDRAEVVLLGVPDMGAIPRLAQPLRAVAGWRGDRLDAIVREVARDTGSVYVDIAGRTGPAFRADPDRFFAADEFHPSDAGYRRWSEAVLEVLRSTTMAP